VTRVESIAAAAVDRPDALRAAGGSDAGVQREVNEDRFYCDAARGIFIVIDGVGGQAAGGRAADVANDVLRERLTQQSGSVTERLRDAITAANNDIHRLAATRAEWDGMACVLTAAIVGNGTVTFGHVGDTRLYKLRADQIEKLTRDHSPVGEREDANEISERQAMRHPRRNEVYRDVGSEFHDRRDRDFVDLGEVAFEPDAALLLCSDGLTDLLDSVTLARTVSQWAGDPESVVRELIAAANAAGGKDNVTAVYVEGEKFAASGYGGAQIQSRSVTAVSNRIDRGSMGHRSKRDRSNGLSAVRFLTVALLVSLAAVVALGAFGWTFDDVRTVVAGWTGQSARRAAIVPPGASIAEAIKNAVAGSEIVVEPGEYREQITLTSGVRLVSRVPRGATIRLPAAVPDAAATPAVVARNVSGAALVGFNISGDSATPLPIGVLVQNSTISLIDVEITGATRAAVEFADGGASALIASDIRDNRGSALVIRAGAAPRISHNTFARNGWPDSKVAVVSVHQAGPAFDANVFAGMNESSFSGLNVGAMETLKRDNWFVTALPARSPAAR
jgi:serine/threonine protein phosphatase PrpC